MLDPGTALDALEQRRQALSSWDNEGGAKAPAAHAVRADAPDMANAELVHLHIRVILLRPGFTQHPLTIQAADHVTDLVDRAVHFRTVQPS